MTPRRLEPVPGDWQRAPAVVAHVTLNHRDIWGGVAWNTPDHRAVGCATLDAVVDAGNRWILPELGEQGLQPWDGVCWTAVAGSGRPTRAVDATAGLERAVRSLLEHRTYIEALTQEGPERYCRTFLTGMAEAAAERFGRPARGHLRGLRPVSGSPRELSG